MKNEKTQYTDMKGIKMKNQTYIYIYFGTVSATTQKRSNYLKTYRRL